MTWTLAVAVVVVFAVVIERLDLPGRVREVSRRSRDSLDVLRDPSLDDAAKEEALQEQAAGLFRLLGLLGGGSLLALGLPLGGVWLLEQAGVASLASVLEVLERGDFLLGVTVAGLGAWLGFRWAGRS